MTEPDTTGEFAKVLHEKMADEKSPAWPEPGAWTAQYENKYGRENRIEALRAASRVIAGICSGQGTPQIDGKDVGNNEAVLVMAEQYAKWLGDG